MNLITGQLLPASMACTRQILSTNGTEFVIPSYHQFDFGPFVFAKKLLEKWISQEVLRYDIRSFKNFALYSAPNPVTGFDTAVSSNTPGADTVFSNFNKTFAGIVRKRRLYVQCTDKFSFKANIARGFRAPNISEISANGVHPGTNIYQLGNPNFKPEFSFQEDAGFSIPPNRLNFRLVFSITISRITFTTRSW